MKKTLILIVLLVWMTGCNASDSFEIELVPGKDIVEIGNEHVDEGCHLVTGDSRLPMDVIKNTVDTSRIGEYEIVYRLVEQGEHHVCKRIVKVIEEGPIRASLNPGIDTITVGGEHVDAGIDVSKDDVTITVTSTLDSNTPGTYFIAYRIIDTDENEITITRLVTVLEAG